MQEPKKEAPKVVHKGYTCDGCQMHDIAGIRYKCSVCNNYDLCEKCEATCDHPHAFLKIRHPRQAPVKIFVVLNDEEDSVEINGQRQPLNGLSELLENGLNFAQQFLNPNGQRFNFNSQQQTGMKEAPKQETEKSEVKQEKPEKKQETKKEEKMEVKVEEKVEVKPRETIPCLEEKGQK